MRHAEEANLVGHETLHHSSRSQRVVDICRQGMENQAVDEVYLQTDEGRGHGLPQLGLYLNSSIGRIGSGILA